MEDSYGSRFIPALGVGFFQACAACRIFQLVSIMALLCSNRLQS